MTPRRPPAQAMKMGSEVYHNLKSVIKKKYGQDACNVGDEGGFAPNILDNKEGLDLVVEAIEKAGYTGKVKIGMDVAASEFWKEEEKVYDLDFKTENNDGAQSGRAAAARAPFPPEPSRKRHVGSQKMSGESLLSMYEQFCSDYPMVSIEDPFDQDDFASYGAMTAKLGESCQVVGDDLLVTNPTRVQKAIDDKACNALLLKVNQIGSITEASRPAGASTSLALRAIPLFVGDRGGQHGAKGGLGRDDVPPLRRDGGLLHRRPRRRPQDGTDQDGCALPVRAARKVRPPSPLPPLPSCRLWPRGRRLSGPPRPPPAAHRGSPRADKGTTSCCASRRSSGIAPSTRAPTSDPRQSETPRFLVLPYTAYSAGRRAGSLRHARGRLAGPTVLGPSALPRSVSPLILILSPLMPIA